MRFKYMLSKEIHFKYRHRLKVKEWKKIYHINCNEKKFNIAIIISGIEDFTARIIEKYEKDIS